MDSSLVPITKLAREPYSHVLGYPRATSKEIARRIQELRKIGISKVCFKGPTLINNLPVLGKGYVGVVVLSRRRRDYVALKIRRMDSSRTGMTSEAKFLRLANKVNVGPKMLASSKNFIIMEYLEGKKLVDWIRDLKGRGSALKFRTTIRKILEDCYTLDNIHLDHGELSYLHKHIIVGRSPQIIDFESASTHRRVSNVTSATQAIFIGSGLANMVKKIMKTPNKNELIASLKKYKHEQSRENFDTVLKVLRLHKV